MPSLTGLFTLGRDAELRQLPNGESVCDLSLAFNYGRKDSQGNRPTQWIKATLWGKRADSLAQYLQKGKQVYAVLSEPYIEEFQGRDGSTRSALKARVDDIEFCRGAQSNGQQPAPVPVPQQPVQQPRQQAPAAAQDFDDDITF